MAILRTGERDFRYGQEPGLGNLRNLEIGAGAGENTNAPAIKKAGQGPSTTPPPAIKDNAENAFVLWNVPQIAKVYAWEWERL